MQLHSCTRRILSVCLLGLVMACQLTAADDVKKEGPTSVSLTPVVTFVDVQGDKSKFREDWRMSDGWTGGIEEFILKQKLGKGTTFDLEGYAILDQNEYKFRMDLEKENFGFIKMGFSQVPEYYDTNGGYFPLFTRPAFELNREPRLDVGNFFIDLGLTLPDVPKITLGYEHQYRDGVKSLLEWGGVTQTVANPNPAFLPQGTITKNIYPSFKLIDEKVDIFKFGIEHDLDKLHLGDEFQYERYNDYSQRTDTELNLDSSSRKTVTVTERTDSDLFSNTFHMDSQLNEKVYWATGYLFMTMHGGGGGTSISTVPFVDPNDKNWYTQSLDLQQQSHTCNMNFMFGPFEGLFFYTGLQAEKTATDGFANTILTQQSDPGPGVESPNGVIKTQLNKEGVQETFGVRYASIPFTVLYAEGKLSQINYDQFGQELVDGAMDTDPAFLHDTEIQVHKEEYTVGFNTAPIQRVSLSSRYRHKVTDYDADNRQYSGGFPGYITGQKFVTDDFTAKLTYRPMTRLMMALQYQLQNTDIYNTTIGVDDSVPPTPGGQSHSGQYQANIFSASVTVTPINRMYVTGMVSYQDAISNGFNPDSSAVVSYRGNVYTVLGSVGYAIDEKTDAMVEYSYWRADNAKNNEYSSSPAAGSTNDDFGMAYRFDNERHGLGASVVRRISDTVAVRLRYGYYQYRDPGMGNIDNYTAHLASASCTVRF